MYKCQQEVDQEEEADQDHKEAAEWKVFGQMAFHPQQALCHQQNRLCQLEALCHRQEALFHQEEALFHLLCKLAAI